ncbi:hypothetical protein V5T82_07270 [Magnetovibrio sp. PR-2]|uniref:hypothetical protein n=1 Tax=Magnetovibrio sp. PR-2 TaxID=3120356 RepID=UPI002FCE3204
MSQTKFDIASGALTRLGGNTIQDFSEDSHEATVVANIYDSLFEQALTEYNWNFAKKNTQLSKTTSTPVDPNWSYEYALPSDYLRAVQVMNTAGGGLTYASDYSIEQQFVYANQDGLLMKYLYKPDESNLPPWFVYYFQSALAYHICEPITGVGSTKEVLWRELDDYRRKATVQDKLENPAQSAFPISSLILARR